MERRLAAIMAADMVGYSRLVEADEPGTLARQKRRRAEIIDPLVETHRGRIVKLMGDGLLVEFPSVVQAVQCAVAVQRGMADAEAEIPEDRCIRYRIAVNLGDVIFDEDGDVYGDGVNIAARLEALAEPGGVVVSGTAYDHLKANVEVGYEDLGERRVKNIATPVRVYRVALNGVDKAPRPRTRRLRSVVAAAVLTAILAAVGGWWWSGRPDFTPADPMRMEYALDEPSIAVLAFDNLTGDRAQEHVSDGISEDIISTLARVPGIVVISRNSSFAYKGEQVDVRRIAEELSVRYVLEGSLQSFGETVRVTAQLIDAVSGRHVWSRRFDRPRAEFFEVRDTIIGEIIGELNSELVDWDTVFHRVNAFESMEAWLLSREFWHHARRFSRADNQIALDIGMKILKIEPNSAWAHAAVAFRLSWIYRARWSDDPDEALRQAEEHARKAIALDSNSPQGWSALAWVRYAEERFDEAIANSERALELAPGDSDQLALLGIYLQKDMQVVRSVEIFERVARMNRNAPGWFWESYGESLRIIGRFESALPIYETALKQGVFGTSRAETHLGLAVCHDALGRPDEAREQVDAAIKALPEVSVAFLRKAIPYKDQAYKDRWLATLRRLGLPES